MDSRVSKTMQIKTISPALISKVEVRNFISRHLHSDTAGLALSIKDSDFSFPLIPILDLISLYQKAEKKLPFWVEKYCILTSKSYEQATSQRLASYKFCKENGTRALVLCGGLGVDDWALSVPFKEVVSLDPDTELNDISRYNNKVLGANNIERLTGTAEDFLASNKSHFDLVYCDPDRRPHSTRVSGLEDCEPDVIALLPQLLEAGEKVVIKASPMINIKESLQQLNNAVRTEVIAVNGEVKEVLFTIGKTVKESSFTATDLKEDKIFTFTSAKPSEHLAGENISAAYFFVPNAAIVKAGLGPEYARCTETVTPLKSGAYAKGNVVPADYGGRIFTIVCEMDFSKKNLKTYLKKNKIKKANVARKNFRLSVEELRKQFGVADGGEDYLFFYDTLSGIPVMVHCKKALTLESNKS